MRPVTPIRFEVTFHTATGHKVREQHRTRIDYDLRASALGWTVSNVVPVPPYSLLVDAPTPPRS